MYGYSRFLPAVLGPCPPKPAVPDFEWYDNHGIGGKISTTADAAPYVETGNVTGTNMDIVENKRGGWQIMATGATLGHHVNWALNGGSFIPGDGWEQMFYWTGYLDDVSGTSYACGFTDPTITDVNDDAVKNGFGFWTPNGDGVIYAFCGNGTNQTSTSTGVTIADAEEVELSAICRDGAEVIFYVNGAEVHRTKSYVPSVDLTYFLEAETLEAASNLVYHNTSYAGQFEKP